MFPAIFKWQNFKRFLCSTVFRVSDFNLLAACAFGLEAVVKRELQALGFDARGVQPGKIGFRGDWDAVAKAKPEIHMAKR